MILRLLWRRRTFVTTIGPLVMWALARPIPVGFVAGVFFLFAGHAIRVWAAGYLNKRNELATSGPFAYTRNPLYLGSFLIACGYALMTWRLVVAIPVLLLFVIFHGGAVLYEEEDLRRRFGQAYIDYCKRVPRIIPRLTKNVSAGRFSWEMVMRNNEYRSIAGTLALTVLFGLVLVFPTASPLRWLKEIVS